MIELGYEPSIKTVARQVMNPVAIKQEKNDIYIDCTSDSFASSGEAVALSSILAQKCINSNDPWGAIDHYKNIVNDANHLVEQLISQSLLSVQADYEQHKSAMLAQKLQTKRLTIIYMTIIGALLLLAVILLFRWRATRQRNRRMELEMNLRVLSDEMAQIKTELAESREACQNLHDEAATNAIMFRKQSALVFLSKFEWVEKLGNMYLDADAAPNSSRALQTKVKEELSGFKKELTDMVNANSDNLIARIEAQCPSLTASEMDYVVLSCVGLSPRVIAFLLSKTVPTVYNLKSRARAKISSEAPALFAEYCALAPTRH